MVLLASAIGLFPTVERHSCTTLQDSHTSTSTTGPILVGSVARRIRVMNEEEPTESTNHCKKVAHVLST